MDINQKVIVLEEVEVSYLTPFLFPGKKREWKRVKALRKINLRVEKGESVVIVGDNGAGKSTLLKVIAGLLSPDSGRVEVKGKIRTLFEAGAGFRPESTGWENIFIQGALFGFSTGQMQEKAKRIAEFASLGDYLYAPLRTYSEGMYIRLAFSIAVHTEPEIFLVDDILSVGDIYFQKKSLEKLLELREKGVTLLLVTHSPSLAERLGDRAIWLEKGEIISEGEVGKVIEAYTTVSVHKEKREILERGNLKILYTGGRWIPFWKGKPLTTSWGAYTTFIVGREVIISPLQEWEVIDKGENFLEVKGEFLTLPVLQRWRMEIVEEGEWEWRISHEVKGSFSFQALQAGIVWNSEYRSIKDRETFTFPLHFPPDWEEVGERKETWLPFSLHPQGEELPVIEMGVFSPVEKIRLFLSGEGKGGKAIFWENSALGDLVLRFRESGVRKERSEWVRIKDGNLSIYYGGRELTFNGGLTLAFSLQGEEYFTDRMKGESYLWGERGKLIFEEEKLPLILELIWREKKEILYWSFYAYVREEVEITRPRLILNVTSEYECWFTPEKKGEFPPTATPSEWLSLPQVFHSFLGVEGKDLPGIVLSLDYPSTFWSSVQKGERERILQFYTLPFKLKKGIHLLFSGKIEIGREEREEVKRERGQEVSLKKGELTFLWEEGRGRILWKGKELTGAWGLYWSVKRGEDWEESFKSLWRVKGRKEDTLYIEGEGLNPPHRRSKWRFKLDKERLKIWAEVEVKGEIEEIHFSLMLKENYKKISLSGEEGSFPPFTSKWEEIKEGKGEVRIIGETFPPLLFQGFYPQVIIKNTPLHWRGRVLEYVKKERINRDREIFQGEIIIE